MGSKQDPRIRAISQSRKENYALVIHTQKMQFQNFEEKNNNAKQISHLHGWSQKLLSYDPNNHYHDPNMIGGKTTVSWRICGSNQNVDWNEWSGDKYPNIQKPESTINSHSFRRLLLMTRPSSSRSPSPQSWRWIATTFYSCAPKWIATTFQRASAQIKTASGSFCQILTHLDWY